MTIILRMRIATKWWTIAKETASYDISYYSTIIGLYYADYRTKFCVRGCDIARGVYTYVIYVYVIPPL